MLETIEGLLKRNFQQEKKLIRKTQEPEGLLAGVTGLKPLGLATIEGLVNGFPLKLLRRVLLISEFLELGFDLLVTGEGEGDPFEETAMVGDFRME